MGNVPASAWPKPYLLQLYHQAIAQGCIRVHVRSKKEYESLRAAFYRLRRRSDIDHKLFIEESFHLCTCSWEDDRQTMLITYNKLPDDTDLPRIEGVGGEEFAAVPPPKVTVSQVETLEAPEPSKPFDATAHVRELLTRIGLDDENESEPTDL